MTPIRSQSRFVLRKTTPSKKNLMHLSANIRFCCFHFYSQGYMHKVYVIIYSTVTVTVLNFDWRIWSEM